MKTVYFYVGLPGSGKTFYAKQKEKETGGILIDDIKEFLQLQNALSQNDIVVVTDPHLCDYKMRMKAVEVCQKLYWDINIEWIFFENNPEKCLKNVAHRNDGRKVEDFIKVLSGIYEKNPPEALTIWQP
jgi:predicted kinase